MKHQIFLLFLLLPLLAHAQEGCPHYPRLMQAARASWAQGDYTLALNQLAAAREHCPDKGPEIDEQLVTFTEEIAEKYREAETATEKARREAAAAQKARARADTTAAEARRAALRAYANDLAYKSEIALRDGDRTSAFRLAEFAHRYVGVDNDNVTRALVNALYYNDKPGGGCLPWCANLEGHTSAVWSVAFSPDGTQLATGSYDKTAKVWNLQTGKAALTLEGHTSDVRSVAFSPDGTQLATGSSDKTAKVWNLQTGKAALTLEGHTSDVWSVAFSPDGTQLATGSYDKTAKVWNLQTGKVALTLEGHTSDVRSVAFSLDGTQLATGSSDKTAKVWNLQTGKAALTLEGHTSDVRSVALSPDGTQLATGSYDKTAKVWNLQTGKAAFTLEGHTSAVRSVAFSPDGTQLATGSSDKTAKVWNLQTGKAALTLEGHTFSVRSVAFSPDGTQLATGSSDKTAKVWNLQTGKAALTLASHTSSVWSVVFSPDGTQLATGSSDKTAKVWNLQTGKVALTLEGHTSDVRSVAFSPDGTQLATGSYDKTAKVWNLQTGKAALTLEGHTSAVWSVAFSPDGTQLATGSYDKTAKVWNLQTGKAALTLEGHTSNVRSVAFSPDGTQLATGSYDKTARVWNLQTGKAALTLEGHTDYVRSVAFSPDGTQLATGSYDKTAKVWNLQTGKAALTLEGHTFSVRSVAFSPDGTQLATGSYDKTAKVWNLQTGKAALTLEGHTDYVRSVAFSPDGTQLATSSSDKTAKVWQLDAAAIIRQLHGQRRLATLILPQLDAWDMERLLALRSDNEQRLRQTNESWQVAAFARLSAQLTRNSQDLARTAPDYARAARLYQYAINSGGDSLLVRELGELYKRHTMDILGSERPDTALRYARLAFQFLPNDSETLGTLAQARLSAPAGKDIAVENNPVVLRAAADQLFEKKNWRAADQLYERAEELKHHPASLIGLYQVAKETGRPFNFQRFLSSEVPAELRQYADHFYEQEAWEYASQLYEKVEGMEHQTESLLRRQECAEKAGQPFDFQRFLSSEAPAELRQYANHFYKQEAWEQAAQLYEKAEGLEHQVESLLRWQECAERAGQPFDFQRFLSSEVPTELRQYVSYFANRGNGSLRSANLPPLRHCLQIGEHLISVQNSLENRVLVARHCNSLAWNLLFTGGGAEAERVIRRGMELDTANKYLPTNLPHALLLQGKMEEARAAYLKWADEPFGLQELATYREAFLDDFEAFENAGMEIEGLKAMRRVLEEGGSGGR